MHDLRFALRTLRKSPGFALVAILSLALGTGANTAIFSLIDAVMLRLLPVSHPEELVFVNTNGVQMGSVRVSESIRLGSLDYLTQHSGTIAGIAGEVSGAKVGVGVDGQVDRAAGQFVSPDFYSTLGVVPFRGRILNAQDANPDARFAVVSYAYWQRRFGADPAIVGRKITLNHVPFTVVGVTSRDFYGVAMDNPVDIAAPVATMPQVDSGKMSSEQVKPDEAAGTVIARLKPGVSAQQAAAELTPLLRQSLIQMNGENPSRF